MKLLKQGLLAGLVFLLLAGCSGSKLYKVPVEDYQKQVRTLAVLPLLIDGEGISHPQASDVTMLLVQEGKKVVPQLVERLRKKGGYFDVRLAPETSFSGLGAVRSVVGEAERKHVEYRYSPEAVAGVLDTSVADALLVLVMHGVTREEKRWNPYSTRLEYLSTSYNSILWTADVIGRDGSLLWRFTQPAGEVFLALDYADFTEAYWNHVDAVQVKPITLLGLQRTLAEPNEGLFASKTLPKLYDGVVREIVDQLSPGIFSGLKTPAAPAAK